MPFVQRDQADVMPEPTAEVPPAPPLRRIVQELASCSDTWIERVRLSIERRWYERLYSGSNYDVWVISWMPGQSTGFHDHGGASGAYTVVHGALEDHRPGEDARVVAAGEVQEFGPAQIHDVRNTSSAPAISLHAYSPALREMTHYTLEGTELRAAGHPPVVESPSVVVPASRFERSKAALDGPAPCRIDQVLRSARSRLRRLTPREAHRAVEFASATVVDIRPARQRDQEGAIPGALLVERNVLEWRLDPTSPNRLEVAVGHDAEIILICSEGYASSLAAQSLQTLGLWRATDVIGGFKAWDEAGLPTVPPDSRGEARPHLVPTTCRDSA